MQKYRVISFIVVHILIFIHVLWFQNSSLGSFDFQEFFDRFLGKGLSIVVMAEFIFLNLAWIIALAVPMAVLISTLMGFGKLSSETNTLVELEECKEKPSKFSIAGRWQ